jgi:hypothetical protein
MRTPRLRWEVRDEIDGVRIEFCRNRSCSQVSHIIDSTDPHGMIAPELDPGVWFWRARGQRGSVVGSQTSPTWQFTAPIRSATTANTVWGVTLDVNGDGMVMLPSPAPTKHMFGMAR